ncbi:hypothetical protein AK812_SmicGene29579 [Symbiodinium microadriaticum]|uniref:Uncharacterized protein n=1 Tax=Symbiodinium microadriaticum TaxID=2951 RepID=A0A1Q9D1H2_SYMMI|nr:hypothetical protein AK812_SmicGene29579 [Symbiodinium microadriaticum]
MVVGYVPQAGGRDPNEEKLEQEAFRMAKDGEKGCNLAGDLALHEEILELLKTWVQGQDRSELGILCSGRSLSSLAIRIESFFGEQKRGYLCLGEDVEEGLMERVILGEFKARFGENSVIAALAVIVEDEEKDKKRIIHFATHGVKVNNRIKCRDKIRAPGAREKKQILRELEEAEGEEAFSVVGDVSKAQR